ncbi:MAG: glycosyltransferase [Alphaproteobacteria bacterium]|nr:glycosyltransferase [Alphaproteobacteria bacterium]
MPETKPIPFTVLQVTPALDGGGVERTTVDIARAIIAVGSKAVIATAGGRLVPEARRIGATVMVGPYDSKNPLVIRRNASRLAALIKSEQVSLVHARSRAPAWSAMWAARRVGVPFVTTYAGIHKARNALKRAYNAIMASGDIVIANSNFTAEHVLAEHKIDPAKLVTIPRGVDVDAFTPANVSEERVAKLREQWNVGTAPVILLPGRLTRLKGHATFLDALAKLPHRNFVAVLAGGGGGDRDHYVAELKQQIAKLGLEQNVRMPGHVSDMPAAYLIADVAVSPSTVPESFGRTPVDAEAMGTPVVATALGGQLETVEDGATGFLVPPFDADALAAAIQRALSMSKDEREAMAALGRTRVLERYTVDAMCAATLDVYRNLLAHG